MDYILKTIRRKSDAEAESATKKLLNPLLNKVNNRSAQSDKLNG